jgi:hypothetical protein
VPMKRTSRAVRLSEVERAAITHAVRSWLKLVLIAGIGGGRVKDAGARRLREWVKAAERLLDRREFRDADEVDDA